MMPKPLDPRGFLFHLRCCVRRPMSVLVSSQEFDALMARLGPFEPHPRLGVAVSGGADSLCLAVLLNDWARARDGVVIAATVDHALRPESADEALRVGQWLRSLGIEHHVLRWEGDKPGADIQDAARRARYRLLEAWGRHQSLLHVAVAHHQGDQAETLMLRLGRGSGVDGLAAMASIQDGLYLRWIRPLLSLPPDRLRATLTARGMRWIEDPSNRNPIFARARMRSLLPDLAAEGLTGQRLSDTASRLGRARAALEHAVAVAAATYVTPHPAGFAWMKQAALARLPEEIGLRLLGRLLLAVGGEQYPARAERLERLYARLRDGVGVTATLAGCRVIAQSDGRVLAVREAGRMAAAVALIPGQEGEWDNRIRFLVEKDAPKGLSLGGLGGGEWRRMARNGWRCEPGVPAAARSGLAAVFDEEGLCAVPHLGYKRSNMAGRTLRWIIVAASNPLTVAGHCLV